MPTWASSRTQDLAKGGRHAPQQSSLCYQGARADRPSRAPGQQKTWPSTNSTLGTQVLEHQSGQDAHCPRHNRPSSPPCEGPRQQASLPGVQDIAEACLPPRLRTSSRNLEGSNRGSRSQRPNRETDHQSQAQGSGVESQGMEPDGHRFVTVMTYQRGR